MKIALLPLLVISFITSYTQKPYCYVYRDSTAFVMFGRSYEETKDSLKKGWTDKGLPEEAADQVAEQARDLLSQMSFYDVLEKQACVRDSITIIYSSRIRSTGNFRMEKFPDSMMMYKGEKYLPGSSPTGFATEPVAGKERSFLLTGNTKTILDHVCKEYISADSSCRVWASPDLPAALNPGIRAKGIDGAILAYEIVILPIYTKCEITRISSKKHQRL